LERLVPRLLSLSERENKSPLEVRALLRDKLGGDDGKGDQPKAVA
jgi:hypothetical protein